LKSLRAKLDSLPREPGVYVFRDASGEVIYVGKARCLPDRVRSYFQTPADWDQKGAALRGDIKDLEATVCASEIDALMLEATLIKKYMPRYNVILRDDKSYPYIGVTVSDEFPRVSLIRGRKVKGTRYYGPYISAKAARRTLSLLRKVFPLRHCTGPQPGQRSGGRCLYYEMRMCMGPCTGHVDREEYAKVVKLFCDFLEGRHSEVVKELDLAMRRASRAREYEEAARLRNRLEAANKVISHSRALSSSAGDYDVIGSYSTELSACFAVAQNRGGMHLGNLCFVTELLEDMPTSELLSEFLKRYYVNASSIPRQVVVAEEPEDDVLAEWLSAERGSRVKISVPARGGKVSELKLAKANARLALENRKLDRMRDKARVDAGLADLVEALHLSKYPLVIECYDISTLGGTASVGSMVAFRDGIPDRRNYRKFSMKYTTGVDDVGMMKEVLFRRLKRLSLSEDVTPEASGFERRPDLVLLDGGKGQLGAGVEVMKVLRLDIEVAALAKRLEEVYRPGASQAILLPRDSEALFILERIRDEAHRFAVEYHRSIMQKRTASSWLDSIAGVGPNRKKVLIKHFGSPRAVARAPLEELIEVKGVPEPVARAVFEAARRRETESAA
jgi:excinuclease ABC subunit C